MNVLHYDNILSSLLGYVKEESAYESEILVSSGSLHADTSKDLFIHVNQITGVKMKLWEYRCMLMRINV